MSKISSPHNGLSRRTILKGSALLAIALASRVRAFDDVVPNVANGGSGPFPIPGSTRTAAIISQQALTSNHRISTTSRAPSRAATLSQEWGPTTRAIDCRSEAPQPITV